MYTGLFTAKLECSGLNKYRIYDECCSASGYKCMEEEGDCDSHEQCQPGLKCLRLCPPKPRFNPKYDDCCIKEGIWYFLFYYLILF